METLLLKERIEVLEAKVEDLEDRIKDLLKLIDRVNSKASAWMRTY